MNRSFFAALAVALVAKPAISAVAGTCKDGQARLFTDYRAESVDDSVCVQLSECNQNEMVILPLGVQAKKTCIPRVTPADSKVKSPYALLAYFPKNTLLPYQSVDHCSPTQVPVFWNYLGNYVCQEKAKTPAPDAVKAPASSENSVFDYASCVITASDWTGTRNLLADGRPIESKNAIAEDQPDTRTLVDLVADCEDLHKQGTCGSCLLAGMNNGQPADCVITPPEFGGNRGLLVNGQRIAQAGIQPTEGESDLTSALLMNVCSFLKSWNLCGRCHLGPEPH